MADTIAAIATPPGRGGVGIVRISGPNAGEVLSRLVPSRRVWDSHHLYFSRIHDLAGHLVDEALAVLMRGPHSYTGEDVAELQVHGGPIILRRVLDACLGAGARIARPGEFTERAYLNGRLDLTQAEAVADMVNATSEAAHRLALEHLEGSLGKAVQGFQDKVVEAMILVESAIDFSHEEHVYQIEFDEILRRIDGVLPELERLRATFDQGRRQREGVRVVILGPTNAGKSTLFNTLHGSERAIVTPVAGTTRDFLEEEVLVDGVSLRLVDTAGLRATDDTVEVIGIRRSRELMDRADLVVWLVDQSVPLPDESRDALQRLALQARPTLVVLNKQDLACGLSDTDQALVERFEHVVRTSHAGQRSGKDALLGALAALGRELTAGEGVLLSRARHLQHIVSTIEALDRARESLSLGMDHEIIALDLREALDALGEIVGRVTTDDILHRIFAEFCVGK